eukprot:CAMPEP_0168354302 /NCGR_PEP_ID=MMETSP0213-20121227/23817_1 /TAXON_ID=151035 /ORGANISM="Euplotes harpa, Strain FSP1.4" /LENGTH=209 /DNA_ID=CAMNT_0008366181 /DNA_START=13 /DNA_END=642 /DNA_ORIENTATION=+
MEFFYKPPNQGHAECKHLEENYMNCLLQKALDDKVKVNRCVMSNILWFHLECPRALQKFDDPLLFKKRFKEFFDETYYTKMSKEYNRPVANDFKGKGGVLYPEDIEKFDDFEELQKRHASSFPDEVEDPKAKPEIPAEFASSKLFSISDLNTRKVLEPKNTREFWNKLVQQDLEAVSENAEKRKKWLLGEEAPAEAAEDAGEGQDSNEE